MALAPPYLKLQVYVDRNLNLSFKLNVGQQSQKNELEVPSGIRVISSRHGFQP